VRARRPGDGQGRLPGFGVAALQEQRRAAGPDLGERAQSRVHPGQPRQSPAAGTRPRCQAQDTPPCRGSGGHQHAVAGIGDDDQLTRLGERGDDLRGVRAAGPAHTLAAQRAPRPGSSAGVAARDRDVRPDADRHAEAGAADGRDRLLPAGSRKAVGLDYSIAAARLT
jgi:hypothetical protein